MLQQPQTFDILQLQKGHFVLAGHGVEPGLAVHAAVVNRDFAVEPGRVALPDVLVVAKRPRNRVRGDRQRPGLGDLAALLVVFPITKILIKFKFSFINMNWSQFLNVFSILLKLKLFLTGKNIIYNCIFYYNSPRIIINWAIKYNF